VSAGLIRSLASKGNRITEQKRITAIAAKYIYIYISARNLPPISGRVTRDSVKSSDDRLARKA
jgi:hypothetical protein